MVLSPQGNHAVHRNEAESNLALFDASEVHPDKQGSRRLLLHKEQRHL
jgi:hypothetical protein